MVWTRKELIKKYIEFFKKHGHKEIPNASLVPENDPTTLFIGSGMETIVPYLLGEKHPLGKRLVNVQRCIRTTDIEEVGDTYHHTFFEMLGNWSIGDYWKKEAIEMTYEFLTKTLRIPPERLAASCFKGDSNAPKDTESEKTYLELGFPKERIAFLDKKSNFWGPVGTTGPCGPNTEIFYWKLINKPAPKTFNPNDENWLEIGNNVLMEFNKDSKGKFEPLKQKNIDFGGGVERTIATLNNFDDNYLGDMWQPIIKEIEKLSGKSYKGNEKAMRTLADHTKAAVMIIANGVLPSNTGRGYVLRRLLRRAVRHGMRLNIKDFTDKIAKSVFKIYEDYSDLKKNKKEIIKTLKEEEEKFNKTIEKGLKVFDKKVLEWVSNNKKSVKMLSGKDAFLLYQSYGFPLEMIEEEIKSLRKGLLLKVDVKGFKAELSKHQQLSKSTSSQKFKSGLADNSKQTTKLHTATHLLNEALREVLDKDIKQKGSNITPERLRFDFNFPRKLTDEEKKKIEYIVNKKISENLNVTREEMPLKKAIDSGAQSEFGARYPEIVSVYTMGNLSKEICTGPHVENTKELGKFKIIKEESVAAGVRRIKATVGN
ncbi:MAG: alanine--tRNA ligase [Nanoarchaeota archaeon]|nr:alanine--tRNA ligase [Nanoarchaeota archaeon]